MIDDETRAPRSVPVPRRPLDDAPLGSPAPPLGPPVWSSGFGQDTRRPDDATRVSGGPAWDEDATRVGHWDDATRIGQGDDVTRVGQWDDATRVGQWDDATRVGQWDGDATRIGGAPATFDSTAVVGGPVADAGHPAIEATTAISARRRAELAAESPVDATAAIASVRPVFVDERGRRTRGIKFGVYSVVAVCIVFLVVVGISLAAGNRGPLMEIPLLGGASSAEASDTVDTDEIAPPPQPVVEETPEATTAARPAPTTTRAPAAPVAVPAAPVTTAPPAPTTTIAPPTTTVAPTTTTRRGSTRTQTPKPSSETGSGTDGNPDTIAAPVTNQ
jgi:hypothetical protein